MRLQSWRNRESLERVGCGRDLFFILAVWQETSPQPTFFLQAVGWLWKWDEFRDRHGDRGRDMVLYLGRRVCGLKLRELAEAIGLPNYAVVATNSKRYEKWLQGDRAEQARMKGVRQLLNCEM